MIRHQRYPIVIIGAGPAGLTAAYDLVKRGFSLVVLEKGNRVGGIARTEEYQGYRFDIGGHRFYTQVPEVQQLWQEVMVEDFLQVQRLSRIFYRGQYYSYPLELRTTFRNLGLKESTRILLSYCKWRVRPYPQEETFEEWVTNRFGKRLYLHFFHTYTEKVWGIPCNKIQADWAAQRIKGLSLTTIVFKALGLRNNTKSLINAFHYPALGPGMMWERFQQIVNTRGGQVRLQTDVVAIKRRDNQITAVVVETDQTRYEIAADHFISTMPLRELIAKLDPPPPADVIQAAQGLAYRDFILVGLIINRSELFPDNWLYIHSPNVKVGRIQNFKNWSAAMVPDSGMTSLGMEYFCSEGDAIWEMEDAELIRLATAELTVLGLASAEEVTDGVVIRQPKAYPVYDGEYRKHLQVLQSYLATLTNLQTIGRNGMHRYNNQDHSMLTGLLAVRNLLGEQHDLWNVNTERSYYEEFTVTTPQA
jgi:protoporphyrinogen oxidase